MSRLLVVEMEVPVFGALRVEVRTFRVVRLESTIDEALCRTPLFTDANSRGRDSSLLKVSGESLECEKAVRVRQGNRMVWAVAEFDELGFFNGFHRSGIESSVRPGVLSRKMVFEVGSSSRASSGHENATTCNGTFDRSVRAVVLMGY